MRRTYQHPFPLPPLKFGPAIEGRQGKLVQKMKAHASESGQVHAQHPAICGQVTKKKCTVSSAQNEDSRFKQAAANFFAAKVKISTSESGPK
jgi:hypothetical protein